MMKNSPKLPTASKTSKSTLLSPRKSYIASSPSDIPGFPSPMKPGRSITERNLIVTKDSEALLPKELAKELKNGSRQEVGALERWTHEQLATIHSNNNNELTGVQKQKQYSEQIKVTDTSMELLSKMVEIHCIDKAQLLRKLWASSGDLYQALYTEQSTVIHDLKLSLSEKTAMIARLEDSVERLRASTVLKEQGGHSKPSTAAAGNKNSSSTTHSMGKSGAFSEHENDQFRLLQEELILKNQEMMQLQGILTSLSVWFPNFSRFSTSVLSKYLPPVDYLQQLEEERVAEEKKQKTLQQAAELRAGTGTPGRGALGGIGEAAAADAEDGEGSLEAQLKKEREEIDRVELAQDFLLKDLKRLQGLGVGFAVLDPVEYDAAKAVMANSLSAAQSTGVFAAPGEKRVTATVPAPVPEVLVAALSRTSVAVRNKLNSRSQKLQSFVEVQGDEYTLGLHGEGGMEEGAVDAEGGSSPKIRGAPSENAIAAAAAAVRRAFEIDTAAEPAVSAQPFTPASPVLLGEYNCSDYYKLQNVRVSKVNAQEAAQVVASLAADISLKRRPNYYKNKEHKLGSFGAEESENTADSDPLEYEKKYRALLIDAQKMETAQSKAEKRMKEEQKAHHKQLLRLSALITTLQNKLQQSTQSASDMRSQIPHVLFAPMIPRIQTSVPEERCLSQYASEVTSSFLHSGAGECMTSARSVRSAPVQVHMQEGSSHSSRLQVLLNNTSAHRHRVKFGPLEEPLSPSVSASVCQESEPTVSFTVELAKLSTADSTVLGKPCSDRVNTEFFDMEELFSLSEIEQILTRFCAHFVQSAPFIPHASASAADGKGTAGVGIRDELYAVFGQGPDQYVHSSLDSILNGQQARLFPACGGSCGEVFAQHLLQYLSMVGASARATGRDQQVGAFAVRTLQRLRQSVVHLLEQTEPYTASPPTADSVALPPPDAHSQQRSQQRALLACLQQLLGLAFAGTAASSVLLGSAVATEGDHSYLAHMSIAEPRQRALRERVYFDLHLHCFRAMQRYLVRHCGHAGQVRGRTFPVSATERILRRVFTVVLEEGATSRHPPGKNASTSEIYSAPWWRCLTARSLQALKQEVEHFAVNAHRAVAVHQMLSVSFVPSRSGAVAAVDAGSTSFPDSAEAGGSPQSQQLSMGVYDCIQLCMRAVEKQHHRLMETLTYMYRFLQSLHIHNGVLNRTFHLLLAHFLQQGYPSVQDTSAGFSLSAVSTGSFSFAPKTAIVVNLQLMLELQRLQAQGQLDQWTFADAVLRSQPYFLVHALLPMLDTAASQSFRAKFTSEGTGHLTGLQQMLQRSFQQLQQQSDTSESALHTLRTAPVADAVLQSVPMSRFKQSYLISKLLYPAEQAEEAPFAEDTRLPSPTTTAGRSATASATVSRSAKEERLLLQELVGYADALGVSEAEWLHLSSCTASETSRVRINPFLERLLLHGKLSYDENITGVMAPSLVEVVLTTWALQYIVETLSRLRGASMRLKSLFKRDLQATFTLTPRAAPDPSQQQGALRPSIGGAKHTAPSTVQSVSQVAQRSNSNLQADIGSIGDRVLVDLLLGDGCYDLDTFSKVEGHYMLQLQRRVFGAWSRAVEGRTGQLRD